MNLSDVALIGRSDVLSLENAVRLLTRILQIPSFTSIRKTKTDSYLVTSLTTDDPIDLQGYFPLSTNLSVRAESLHPCGRVAFGEAERFLPEADWCETAGPQLRIQAARSDWARRSRITIYAGTVYAGASRNSPEISYSLHFNRLILGGPEAELDYFTSCAEALGISANLNFHMEAAGVHYRIERRDLNKGTIHQIGLTFEDSGPAFHPNICIRTPDRQQVLDLLQRYVKSAGVSEMNVERLYACAPRSRWNEAREFLKTRHDGPWNFVAVNLDREGWKSEELRDGNLPEAMPIGFLGAFKADRKTGALYDLSRRRIAVDLFREASGTGWHYAFHFVEVGTVSQKMRFQASTALNALAGEAIITRTPEQIWPAIFQKGV